MEENLKESLSSKEERDNLFKVSDYYEDFIAYMPGNVYWLDLKCLGVICNLNVLKMLKLNSMEEFKGMSFSDMAQKRWEKEILEASTYQHYILG